MRRTPTRVLLAIGLLVLVGACGSETPEAPPQSATTATTPVTLTAAQDGSVRAAVVQRLGEEQIKVDGAALQIETMGAAGYVLFRALHDQGVAPGTIDPATGAILVLPNDALVKVWQRWIERGGLPDAVEVTRASTFLLSGSERSLVVLTDADREGAAEPALRSKVQLPRLLEGPPRAAVAFWRLRGSKLSEVTLRLEGGTISTTERDVSEV